MMTKKHYEAIAKIFAARASSVPPADAHPFYLGAEESREAIANDLATLFASENPRFDKERFLKACKV